MCAGVEGVSVFVYRRNGVEYFCGGASVCLCVWLCVCDGDACMCFYLFVRLYVCVCVRLPASFN